MNMTILSIISMCLLACTCGQEQPWFQSLLESSTTPFVTALLLGLLTAISPCPLATNIAAIGYIGKRAEDRRKVFWNGVWYTLGRTLAYTLLAWVLLWVIGKGTSLFGVQSFLAEWGERVIGPLILLFGVLMLLGDRLHLPQINMGKSGERLSQHGGWGALLLGIVFALAFCPSSALFYFGMLLPLSATSTAGWLLPVVFAIATALPVLIVAWLLAFSVQQLGKFYGKMQVVQRWLNLIVGLLFIGIGIYYCVIIFI